MAAGRGASSAGAGHRLHRLSFTAAGAHRGRRLDDAVGEWLAEALERPLSRSTVRRLILAGAVRLGGRPLRRPAWRLVPGQRLAAVVDLDRLGARAGPDAARFAGLDERSVLYEDAWLLAVDKPAGLPSHPTADPRRHSLHGILLAFLAARGAGAQRLGVHQRLDRDTSGVVLFTKDPEADAGLASQFVRREVVKTYHALTARPPALPPDAWRVENRLATTRVGRRTASGADGRPARTEFRLLETFPAALFVEARPRTGRKHQVRVHLAEAGLPVLGDATYGGPARLGRRAVPRAMLHAWSLELRHPVTGSALRVVSPHPADFRELLEALREGRHSPVDKRRRQP